MTEQLQVYTDCISEYEKLKQNLVLSEYEREKWIECEFYLKNPHLFRKCNRCGKIKFRTDFYGRYAYCKECKITNSKAQYYKNLIIQYQNKIKECNKKLKQLGA